MKNQPLVESRRAPLQPFRQQGWWPEVELEHVAQGVEIVPNPPVQEGQKGEKKIQRQPKDNHCDWHSRNNHHHLREIRHQNDDSDGGNDPLGFRVQAHRNSYFFGRLSDSLSVPPRGVEA